MTTDGEFYSVDRQLKRLQEEGIEVEWVPSEPAETVGEPAYTLKLNLTPKLAAAAHG